MKVIYLHETLAPKGSTPAVGLPKFDDITQYGASEEQEKEMWMLDVERLLNVAQQRHMPLEFDGEGILGKSNEEGYQQLSDLGDQVLCNLRVCHHDAQLLALEFYPKLCFAQDYRSTKHYLQNRFDESTFEQHPKLLKIRNKEVYSALIDYITAVVARLLVQVAKSRFWHTYCLAALAKWAAKLKYLEQSNP
jgi:hypothetical protein